MAITVEELFEGQGYNRSKIGRTLARKFKVSGADDSEAAGEASGIPDIDDLYESGPMRVVSKNAEPMGADNRHTVNVNYAYSPSSNSERPDDPVDGQEFWLIDLSGQTINQQIAISQTGFGTNKREVGNLIGVKDDGTVEGVDKNVSSGTFTVTLWQDADVIDDDYIDDIMSEYGKINGYAYYGYAPGELLFNGVRIPNRGLDLWELEFVFTFEPNVAEGDMPDLTDDAGDPIIITDGLDGWQYLWLDQNMVDDGTDIKWAVRGAYKSDVYEESNFSDLPLSGDRF